MTDIVERLGPDKVLQEARELLRFYQASDPLKPYTCSVIADCISMIEALRAASEWRDISTAPRDGLPVELWHRVWCCPITVQWKIGAQPRPSPEQRGEEVSHTPFPWSTHPQVPTAVFDANGRRIVWDAPGRWDPIETAPKDRFILVHCHEDDSRWLVKWQGDRWYGVDVEHGLTREGHSHGDTNYVTGWFVSEWCDVPAFRKALPPIDPETAADNAALIAAIPAMVEALAMFLERVERHGNWDDGCFYYGGTSASELQEPMELTRAVLASIGKKP